jgi:organic hydroperoxide reductase OsmC/OhrA
MGHVYEAMVEWHVRDGDDFPRSRYSRAHQWKFDGGAVVPASSSPHIVRLPWSDPAGVDPEEALVAALSSCHMLFFLALAAAADLDLVSYRDNARGEMGRRADGSEAMIAVRLRPEIAFAGDPPTAAQIESLHHRAHALCYIANSVNFPVTVEAAA